MLAKNVFSSVLSFPHILSFMCACWQPRILTSLYPELHACLLASLHAHILVSQIPVYLVASSRPHILMSYSQVCVCLLVSSHPHTIRFIRTCWYPCILISSDSCVSFYPYILSSSFFLYIILIYISQTNIYINTLKKKSCNLQYNKRIKPTRYWTQHRNKPWYTCIQVLHTYIHIIFKKGFIHSIFFAM